jgi:hypothetical protein
MGILTSAVFLTFVLSAAPVWAQDTKTTAAFHTTDGNTDMNWDASADITYIAYDTSGTETMYEWSGSTSPRGVVIHLRTRTGYSYTTAYYRCAIWYGNSEIRRNCALNAQMTHRLLDGSASDDVPWDPGDPDGDFQGEKDVNCKLKLQSGPAWDDLGSGVSPYFLHNTP